MQIKIAEHGDVRTRGISEADAAHVDFAMEAFRGLRVGFHGLGFIAQELAHALGGAEGALELRDEVRELHEGRGNHAAEAGELRELVAADLAAIEHAHGEPSDEDEGHAEGKDDEGDEGRARGGGADDGAQVFTEVFVVAGELVRLISEGFDADDALQRFIDDDLRGGEVVLRLARQFANARAKDGDEHDDDRDGADHEE